MKSRLNIISSIQKILRDSRIDGWLFYDYEGRDKIINSVLNLKQNKLKTRRWCYFIPQEGIPIKIVHVIEKDQLSELPGEVKIYATWNEFHRSIANSLKGCKKIAMQYSPNNDLPNISYVDGGTVELIRSFNVDIVSSANLIQIFASKLTDRNILYHKKAGIGVCKIKDMAFEMIFDTIKRGEKISEFMVQQYILKKFDEINLTSEGLNPVVAVNSHAANPHFECTEQNTVLIKKGDRILIDLWAKVDDPDGIYYDITWCGFIGQRAPKKYNELFRIVIEARNHTKNFITDKLEKNDKIFGWQVDDICRKYISSKGYGKYFTHRTGHSIDRKIHGSGVNLDNFETKDPRELIPGSCFSIEPGIYKNQIGVRTEINMIINKNRRPIIVGEEQENLLLLE